MLLLQNVFEVIVYVKVYNLAVLTFLHCSQKEIAQLACVSERYVGTQAGGMDQVIHIFHLSCTLSFLK